METSGPNSCVIDTTQICWYTKGKYWDYTVLCHPSRPMRSGWLMPLEKIFGDAEPSNIPRHIAGSISWEEESNCSSLQFIAVAFLDPHREDRDGRTIKHYILIIDVTEIQRITLGVGWHLELLDALSIPYDSIYHLKASDLQPQYVSDVHFDFEEIARRFSEKIPQHIKLIATSDHEPCSWEVKNILITDRMSAIKAENLNNSSNWLERTQAWIKNFDFRKLGFLTMFLFAMYLVSISFQRCHKKVKTSQNSSLVEKSVNVLVHRGGADLKISELTPRLDLGSNDQSIDLFDEPKASLMNGHTPKGVRPSMPTPNWDVSPNKD